jgi:hypothetical protein
VADDLWARKRREEEEEARELESAKERADQQAKSNKKLGFTGTVATPISNQFAELIREAPILIEQLNHLYQQFINGVLSLPPREVRARLDHMMVVLMNDAKPTPTSRFQFSAVQASYASHCERWDKMLRGLESGKLKRVRDRGPGFKG